MKLPEKKYIASFDVDAQKTFTPMCPNDLPVIDGDKIVSELNKQAEYASLRIASRDAHSMSALWIASEEKPQYSSIEGYPNLDIRWNAHAIVGTEGFEFIDGLDENCYDFQVYKGVQDDMHPYGACYHDLNDKLSTGVIEYLKYNNIKAVIVGGLATDYCVKNTVLQLLKASFLVILNLSATKGIAVDTTKKAIEEMKNKGCIIVNNTDDLKSYL